MTDALRCILRACGSAAGLVLVVACGADGPGEWQIADGYRWRELAVAGNGGLRVLPPEETGVDVPNVLSTEAALADRTLADGAGVAIGDADGDGWPDLYVARVAAPNVLLRNRGDGRFEPITDAGVGLEGRTSTAAAFVDVDGDHDLDLVVSVLAGPNVLLRNDGTGRYEDVSREAGFELARASRSQAFADVDGDGDLDLYITNNKSPVLRDMFPPERLSLEGVTEQVDGRYVVRPEMAEHFRVVRVGDFVQRFETAEADELYLNRGDGTFDGVQVSGERFLDQDGDPVAGDRLDWGLSARFVDLNEDGRPDLYVCNDFESPDRIWMNRGGGRFREAAHTAIRTTSLACMAVDVSDIDRDGHDDLFTADMEAVSWDRRRRQIAPMTSDTTGPGDYRSRPQRNRNTLQVARGDGTFADLAPMYGVSGSEWSWGSVFVDVDLDGYEDLVVATGHAWDLLDADARFRANQARSSVDWREEYRLYPPLETPNLAFRNLAGQRFEEWGARWGLPREEDIAHGVATGDLDLDGDLDIVMTRLNRAPLVLRNESPASRIAVRLRGRAPNTAAIGARVTVSGHPDLPDQSEGVALGGGYLSSSEPLLSFAAPADGAVMISVEWPGGGTTRIEDVRADRLYEIDQPAAPAALREPPASEDARPDEVWFEAIGPAGVHHETPFDDTRMQPLVNERLSQLGPGVTWMDVDGDGDDDLLTGAGAGGALQLAYNQDGGLRARTSGRAVPLDLSTLLPDPAMRGRVVAGQLNYEAGTYEAATTTPSVIGFTIRGGPPSGAGLVEGSVSAAGPLAQADIDGDGDLDVFVGGRSVPTAYPAPADSRLFLRNGALLASDPDNAEVFRGLGLVSGAVFTDLDLDGDPDLALAMDWSPVRVFENQAGRFREVTGPAGLESLAGRWNGINAGDLDGDGDQDLVVSSWGRNTRYRASADRPLYLYHGDFDGDGRYDMVRARATATDRPIQPLEALLRLARAMPGLRRVSHAEYATAPITAFVGERSGRLEATTLDHTLFINENGRFRAVPLPRDAQVAPGFHVGVADADADGAEDVFLTQNFFPAVTEPRLDAGRSLWLRGDGRGGLEPLDASRSGVAVYGDPRGAAFADFDGDGRVDLAVSQNGAETLVFRNRAADRGLRVSLQGPPGNPTAVGAVLRVRYEDGVGPAREVRSGAGYWSVDSPTQILGLADDPVAVEVRWPGGRRSVVPVPAGTRELRIPGPG